MAFGTNILINISVEKTFSILIRFNVFIGDVKGTSNIIG